MRIDHDGGLLGYEVFCKQWVGSLRTCESRARPNSRIMGRGKARAKGKVEGKATDSNKSKG